MYVCKYVCMYVCIMVSYIWPYVCMYVERLCIYKFMPEENICTDRNKILNVWVYTLLKSKNLEFEGRIEEVSISDDSLDGFSIPIRNSSEDNLTDRTELNNLIHVGTRIRLYACVHVCMYVCMCACMYACMYVCVYACMCVCMYVCMHVCTQR